MEASQHQQFNGGFFSKLLRLDASEHADS